MKKILVLHGPNLNLLGTRETSLYGKISLETINTELLEQAQRQDLYLSIEQSNHEGELIDFIHKAKEEAIDYIIFNPAAYTHTSVALRDALIGVAIPFVEVHISNIFQRETFRHHSYFSDIALGLISGFGTKGYNLAIDAIIGDINTKQS